MIYLFHHEDKYENTNRNHMLVDMRKEEDWHKSGIQKLKKHDTKQKRKNTYKNILCLKSSEVPKAAKILLSQI